MKNLFPALSRKELFTGFSIKLLMGCLYGYIFLHFFPGDDTVHFHLLSLEQTRILRNDPLRFFYEEYTPFPSIARTDNLAEMVRYYLNDLEYALVIKTTAILNLVSQGNYYINMVFFNALVFPGSYWLFRSMHTLFPQKRQLIFLGVFCFLPAVFWLSGIRSDGWLLVFIGMLLFHLTAARRHRLAGVTLGLLGILVLRPQFALLLFPALAGYHLCTHFRQRHGLVFAGVYTAAAVVFFTSAGWLPGDGLPGAMARRQELFLALEGTAYPLDRLQPSLAGFLKLAPQAVANSFFRPLPWEAEGPLQLFAALATALWWGIIVYAFLNREKQWRQRVSQPVILMLLWFSVSVYLSIGYVVPFPGAIVRYRVVAELLILCCALGIVRVKMPRGSSLQG